jgi:hypothetical protein
MESSALGLKNREKERDARHAQRKPHVIVRRQFLAIPHKVVQDFKMSRRAPHGGRHRIPVREHATTPPEPPMSHAFLRKRGRGGEWGVIWEDAKGADVARARRGFGEHVEGADALCGAAQDDA